MNYELPNLNITAFAMEHERQLNSYKAQLKESLVLNTAKMLCELDGKNPEALVEVPLKTSRNDQTHPDIVTIPLYRTYLSKSEALCNILSQSFEMERRALFIQLNEDYGF